MLSLVGIIVGLALLIFLAFRGKSLLWAAPVCALLVAFTGGLDMFTAYTQNYMEGMVGFVKEWFPAFMLGAIFGQIMQDSGGAVSLTKAVVKLVGRDKAIFASVLCGGVLAYGGISGFVIIFSMYPIVLGLFKEADITRRLIPATIMTGAFTFAMSAMPGTPTIQNLIPTEYFGTTATAAPVIGIVCTIIMFVGPVLWLSWRAKKFRAAGEGYDEPDEMPEEVPAAPGLVLLYPLCGHCDPAECVQDEHRGVPAGGDPALPGVPVPDGKGAGQCVSDQCR